MIRIALASLIFVGTAQAQGVAPIIPWPEKSAAETGGAPPSAEDRSWHLLQKQYDGLIRSVQHGLTRHECQFAKARVMGLPATPEEVEAEKIRQEKLAETTKALEARCADPKREKPKVNSIFLDECSIGWSGGGMGVPPTNIQSVECFQ